MGRSTADSNGNAADSSGRAAESSGRAAGFIGSIAGFIGREQLLDREGLHLVALSGGADSVALLRVLLRLGYRVEAAHCNFHLRGGESDRDEAFVEALCREQGVPLHRAHFDTKAYAALHHVSIEMAARDLRYAYFRQLATDIGAQTVCVAHHRDDAVETLLINLLRGSGIHGLTGIRPRNGIVVRPLLCVSRSDIQFFLRSIGQAYVTDSTNLTADVMRNKIRLQLLPLMGDIAPQAADNIARTAGYLAEAERVVDEAVASALACIVRRSGGGTTETVATADLLQLPSPGLVLHEWLAPYGFRPAQTAEVLARITAAETATGAEFHAHAHTLLIDRGTLVLAPQQEPMKPLRIPEPGLYAFGDGQHLRVEVIDDISVSKSADCATLDAAKVQFPLLLRTVQQGDSFVPFGMRGRRLVSDFLTDRKVPLTDKRRQMVVADAAGTIVWLPGWRTSQLCAVTDDTARVLRLTVSSQR